MSWFPKPEARIFCAAVNYAAHREEMGRGESSPHPVLFMRSPQSLGRALTAFEGIVGRYSVGETPSSPVTSRQAVTRRLRAA